MQIAVSGQNAQMPERGIQYEWLLTNQLGGYASGTVAGMPSRRYHGLLIAAFQPENRWMILPQLQEEAHTDEMAWQLGATCYPGGWHPQGYAHLQRYTVYPLPRWVYAGGNWLLAKTVCMAPGANATAVTYELLQSDRPLTLVLRPMVAVRGYHHLQREGQVEYTLSWSGNSHVLRTNKLTPFACFTTEGTFQPEYGAPGALGVWYRNVEYPVERERGLDYIEDWFSPGTYRFTLLPGRSCSFWVSAGEPDEQWAPVVPAAPLVQAQQAHASARARKEQLLMQAGRPSGAAAQLVLAADDFIIRRGRSASVIAGYPWFTDWGRDAMISLPGLFLATGRADEGCSMLKVFAAAMKDGLIPNRFPDAAVTPEYNTVDAPLWFVYAWQQLWQHLGNTAVLRDLWPAVREIITRYKQGTAFNIGVDERGLVHASAEGYQLTWMDAKTGSWVVTPRSGFPVEISALWHNALCSAAAAGVHIEPAFARQCREWAEETRRSFFPAFWLPEKNYLADVLAPDGTVDTSFRPNQLFAVSLPYPLLQGAEARAVVDRCWAKLLTPMGLRTLASDDSAYKPRYGGDQTSRDGAYHQGTVWAWLMGPFITAYRAAYGRNEQTMQICRQLLAPLLDHLSEAGLGHISEIFAGDSPHTPHGCFAQAWSVAELLRIWRSEFAGAPLELTNETLC